MKKIEAVIQPYLLENVKEGLHELGLVGITVSEIKNYRNAPRPIGRGDAGPGGCFGFLPKLKLELVVPDPVYTQAMATVRERGRIENVDDLFATTLCDVIRIRTCEHGDVAI